MIKRIPHEFLDLFEKPSLSHLATLMPDGSPQISPVWVDYDGQYILINTAKGRRKEMNMRERPRVALDIVDPENPFRFLSIRGRVVEITEEGANEHRDKLDTRYLGITTYPIRDPQEIRHICKILPERITINQSLLKPLSCRNVYFIAPLVVSNSKTTEYLSLSVPLYL